MTMNKCQKCGYDHTQDHNQRKIFERIKQEKYEHGKIKTEHKEKMAEELDLSYRQLDKYCKIFLRSDDNEEKAIKKIKEAGSLNKAYNSLLEQKKEHPYIKAYELVSQHTTGLKYGDFEQFLSRYDGRSGN